MSRKSKQNKATRIHPDEAISYAAGKAMVYDRPEAISVRGASRREAGRNAIAIS
ncbi:hypothetical protein [Anabaena azotica]|uniref:Uncharacterized protein n=1 Tax=Anabaena azotica FACHB-119 TaxID=947527 RepID=A0ABR8CXC0_9NOST|nr:hypothetical protein [Anabaena azotica]MBD2499563.1 hypothetical protein [Anabaena azotica FACHB-119]